MNLRQLYSPDAIADRIRTMAQSLNKEFSGQDTVHAVVLLNGAYLFAGDLSRQLHVPLVMHFTGGSVFDGAIKREIKIDENTLPSTFGNRPVLIVEDILDSGKSLSKIRQLCADRQASRIVVASLLKRPHASHLADHFGFTIPQETFVVGYGMDLDGQYRNLPALYAMDDALMGRQGSC